MTTIHPHLNVDQQDIAAFCRKWSVAKLWLFGSVVRDDFRPDSDVDVMVEFVPKAPIDLFDIIEMKYELEELFGRSVDIVEAGTIRNPFKKRNIERDLTMVYAA